MIPICKSMTKYLRKKGVYVYTDAFKGNKILRKKYDAYGKGLAKGVCDYLGIEW